MTIAGISENRRCGGDSGKAISDETFRKREHVLKSKEFRSVYRKGRSSKKNGFILSVAPNSLGYNRLGFSIGSASIKRAYIRNRIRRCFREVYRKNKTILRPGVDMVIIVKKNTGKKFLYEDARSLFMELARGVGVLR